MVYLIPIGVKNPVFLKTAIETKIVDLDVALALCRARQATKKGKIFRCLTDGKTRFSAEIQMFHMKSASGAGQIGVGESARMRPRGPTGGAIMFSGYARLLDQFCAGDDRAKKIVRSRRTARLVGGVPREVQNRTAERSILYFPWEGVTPKVRAAYGSKAKRRKIARIEYLRGTLANGFEILDGAAWVMITSERAVKMLESGEAILKDAGACGAPHRN